MLTKRVRRSKEDAKQAILAAAESILLSEGLDAVRVQRVAAELSITDAAVHYHFGNHAGLVEALLRHCGKKLVAELGSARPAAKQTTDLRAVSRALQRAYVDAGAARLLVWLKLAGWRPRGSGMLSELVQQWHTERTAEPAPSLTDTRYLVTLLNAVHLAQAIAGDALLKAVGAEADQAGQQRFLSWVTARVAELSEQGRQPAAPSERLQHPERRPKPRRP